MESGALVGSSRPRRQLTDPIFLPTTAPKQPDQPLLSSIGILFRCSCENKDGSDRQRTDHRMALRRIFLQSALIRVFLLPV